MFVEGVFNSCWAMLLIRESRFPLHCYHLLVAICPNKMLSCVIATPHPDNAVSAWSFYLAAMLFDFLTLSISTYYLLKVKVKVASA